MRQIRKTYRGINPEMLFDEVKDLVQKQGAVLDDSKMEAYSMPGGAVHTSRGTLVFKMPPAGDKGEQECARVHIVGAAGGETKMMLDIDETLFPEAKVSGLEDDLSFIFGSYEVRPK